MRMNIECAQNFELDWWFSKLQCSAARLRTWNFKDRRKKLSMELKRRVRLILNQKLHFFLIKKQYHKLQKKFQCNFVDLSKGISAQRLSTVLRIQFEDTQRMNQACKKKKAPSFIWSNFIDEVEIKDGCSEKINLIGSISLE